MNLRVFLFCLLFPLIVSAESIIRDAEIESVIKNIASPIFKVAGLNPNSISVYIYQSEELNAFVPEGKIIFISTGLISFSEKPEILAGVLAHEVGHITGGHIIARKGEFDNFRKQALLSSAIGAIAGLATGSPEVFIGTSMIGGNTAMHQLLHYSRGQESAADQAALKYLHSLGWDNHGLEELLEALKTEERINTDSAMKYLRTHPVSQERINAIRNFESTHKSGKSMDGVLQEKYKRVVAKIRAYSESPSSVVAKYSHDNTIAGKYAVAIANMRIPNFSRAIPMIDGLIAQENNNPYFHEIKGQSLLEMRKINESLEEFKKAYTLLPKNSLMKIQYATVLNIAKKDHQKAVNLLEEAATAEPEFPSCWRQLAIAYGLAGDKLNSNLALTYEATLTGDIKTAKRMLAIAEKDIMQSKDKKAVLRYKDLKQEILEMNELIKNEE